jgi:hypothetical protein
MMQLPLLLLQTHSGYSAANSTAPKDSCALLSRHVRGYQIAENACHASHTFQGCRPCVAPCTTSPLEARPPAAAPSQQQPQPRFPSEPSNRASTSNLTASIPSLSWKVGGHGRKRKASPPSPGTAHRPARLTSDEVANAGRHAFWRAHIA